MSAILKPVTYLAGAAAALVIGLSLAGSAQASTTSKLLQCKAGSRGAVIDCCQQIVRTRGAPIWLVSSDNCSKAVSCGKYDKKKNCYMTTFILKPEGGNDNIPGKKESYSNKP